MRAITPDVRVSPSSRSRFIAQHALVPMLARTVSPDAMLCLVPGVPLMPVAVPIVSVVYDLRSWIHPEEFPAWVRAYRRIAHHYAFHRSARIVAISERSRLDLGRVCRRGARRMARIAAGSRWRSCRYRTRRGRVSRSIAGVGRETREGSRLPLTRIRTRNVAEHRQLQSWIRSLDYVAAYLGHPLRRSTATKSWKTTSCRNDALTCACSRFTRR